MFGHQRLQRRRFNFGWSIWLIIFSLGFLLFFGQSLLYPVGTEPSRSLSTPTKEELVKESSVAILEERQAEVDETEGAFLDEYDSETIPFLAESSADDKPLWMSTGELALKLLLVIGLVYLALTGLRWLQKSRIQADAGGTTIRVLETTGLAPGRSLHLVVVGEKTLLIGATDHQLSLLAELADVATSPLSEEMSSFDEALSQSKFDNNLSRPLDWQSAFEHLRATVQRIRQHP
ncbi:MAG: flagellar biosynthetic protein FliO [Anaerolineales bacterium]|nr:flagellar biosynthetic protein FliO [Anaerolineales bacterium]